MHVFLFDNSSSLTMQTTANIHFKYYSSPCNCHDPATLRTKQDLRHSAKSYEALRERTYLSHFCSSVRSSRWGVLWIVSPISWFLRSPTADMYVYICICDYVYLYVYHIAFNFSHFYFPRRLHLWNIHSFFLIFPFVSNRLNTDTRHFTEAWRFTTASRSVFTSVHLRLSLSLAFHHLPLSLVFSYHFSPLFFAFPFSINFPLLL